ncbi:hypothetical protein [Streptomyces sp. NPDC097619]|uniref:hypothetical protein n=1 Tax=Streptomyces sp. NPDC097619 TaxID=3157228 RepID=UPI00331E78A1
MTTGSTTRPASRIGRRARARRVTRAVPFGLLLPLSLALALSACGISPTGPVDAGGPASGAPLYPGEARGTRLYFASPYGMRSAARPSSGTPSPQRALELLLQGPTESERARGLTTRIPLLPRTPVATAGLNSVTVRLPLSVAAGELDITALSQIVCTVAHATTLGDAPPDRVVVRVHEAGDTQGWPLRCGPQSLAVPAGATDPPPTPGPSPS